MATVTVPGGWTPTTGGRSTFTYPGDTVGSILDRLAADYPDLRKRIFSGQQIAGWINVYIGDDDVRWAGGLSAAIGPEVDLVILPALAGG
ncbi:MoaD/ThiS family protein [Streptacidiphilus sp. P02-A3a]|uniref:MoaD/ThiS family protein n=1 Tax=Streptacidiphilus sp. P02-A3a TaxID=2704468 RepID=UPI0015F7D8F5|nr:MoaD/ThiS family protein [Streptacidiphilus sp. P02-A3a]QMU72033.1 MoaD/ThiS family protein [Streptacidiphilus sp. P02-A3a]